VALDVGEGTVLVKQVEVPTTTDDAAATAGIFVLDGLVASTRGTWSWLSIGKLRVQLLRTLSLAAVKYWTGSLRLLAILLGSCSTVTKRTLQNTITTHARIVSFKSLEEATKSDRSAGAVNTLIARLDREQNGITPQQQAAFPVTNDFTSGAMSLRDLLPIAGDWQNSSSYPRLASAFATEKVIEGISTDVARLRSFGLSLGIRAIVGHALELQLKKKLREACNPGQPVRLVCNGQTISPVHGE
jgi:hypothetical protein